MWKLTGLDLPVQYTRSAPVLQLVWQDLQVEENRTTGHQDLGTIGAAHAATHTGETSPSGPPTGEITGRDLISF